MRRQRGGEGGGGEEEEDKHHRRCDNLSSFSDRCATFGGERGAILAERARASRIHTRDGISARGEQKKKRKKRINLPAATRRERESMTIAKRIRQNLPTDNTSVTLLQYVHRLARCGQ